MGSSLFSISDIYPKITAFRAALQQKGLVGKPLYFAKVDVSSCFDTIPQSRLISLISSLLCAGSYRIGRYVEVAPPDRHQCADEMVHTLRPKTKYSSHGRAGGDFSSFAQLVEDEFSNGKKQTIFVDSVSRQMQSKEKLMDLVREHLSNNLVKIGKKYYRQKEGIPQGSVLSTLLCNFFYADFEQSCLRFLQREDTMLLRLIDDFLVVSTQKPLVERFVRIMHKGNPDYGLSVKAQKTLTNFAMTVDGSSVKSLPREALFPYCGIQIDPRSLDISKEYEQGEPNRKFTFLSIF